MNQNIGDAELGAMMKTCFGVQGMGTGDLTSSIDTTTTDLGIDTAQGSDKKTEVRNEDKKNIITSMCGFYANLYNFG